MSDGPIFIDLGVAGAATPIDPEALREQAAAALELASRFVEEHAGAFARSRMWSILEAQPVATAVQELEGLQRDDGSFPLLIETPSDSMAVALQRWDADSAVVGTLQALMMLADLRQRVGTIVDRAVEFVSSVQLPDGSWGPAAPDADASNSAEARLFGTAMLTGMLGKTRSVRPEVLAGASHFVAERWAPERVEGGEWGAIAAFANFFTNVHHERGDEALQWCGRELERGFRTRRFEALAVLRVLLTSDAAALPGSKLTPPELLAGLLSEQAADGGFAELESAGLAARIEPTIDAMLAILRLCTAF